MVEWLFHIALDNIHTAFKLSKKAYNKEIIFNTLTFRINPVNDDIDCSFSNERASQIKEEQQKEKERQKKQLLNEIEDRQKKLKEL